MTRFETITEIEDLSEARVLIIALRAHGFHPLEPREGGLPGMVNLTRDAGTAIEVPEDEAEDAKLLAEALLAEMRSA